MIVSRNLPLLFFAAFALILGACQDDDRDDPFGDDPFTNDGRDPVDLDILSLDGPNRTAPLMDAGDHRFAVRFTPGDLDAFDGRALTGVSLFLADVPGYLDIGVFAGGQEVPGAELAYYEYNPADAAVGGFGTYGFDEPIPVDASEALWLVVDVEAVSDGQQLVGCDAGPRQEGGDWLWSQDDWITFFDRTGGEPINWNIRGVLE